MNVSSQEISLPLKEGKFFLPFLFSGFLLWQLLLWLALFVVPSDTAQGIAQRIFYFHVPTAWVSFVGFALTFYYSIRYLMNRSLRYDRLAYVYALCGWVFTSGVLLTGPLWAKPIWGFFWNWTDQRLISFFVLWLLFAAYVLLRGSIPERHKIARISAVLGIIAFLNVPLVYLSVKIWNTPSHPALVVGGKKGSGLFDPSMKYTFFLGLIAFHFLFFSIAYVLSRYFALKDSLLFRQQNSFDNKNI